MPLLNFADNDLDDSHGTEVTSVLLGDYTDGQGEGQLLGDSSTTHTTAWANGATGMAPESDLVYFDVSSGVSTGVAAAFDTAISRHVDIFSGSWGFSPVCVPSAVQPYEQELENAFDDGVFVVMAAGNNDGCGPISSCNIASPADTLKAFAVNAYSASASGCNTDYNTCLLDQCAYRLGGETITTDGGVSVPAAVSQIAMVGPDRAGQLTTNLGNFGTVSPNLPGGSSFAAPTIAGLSAIVKDQYLGQGQSWINEPGWLFAVMLGGADRSYESTPGTTTQRDNGFDRTYGSGRPRLRLLGTNGGLGAIGANYLTLSFSPGASPWSSVLWSTPLPASTGVVKCVLYQIEDMSPPKAEISDIDLKLELFTPYFGNSCALSTGIVATRVNNSLDNKSMVAFDSAHTPLGSRCAKLTVSPYYVTSYGVTTRTFCYFATARDDQAPQ